MIFCTVGLERFPFNRLVKEVDRIAAAISEEVFIQLGNTDYIPKNCAWERFVSFRKMQNLIQKSRIVLAHAGAGTFLLCRSLDRIPILAPRTKSLNEHVSDHQLEFCRKLELMNKAVVVYDFKTLMSKITGYDTEIRKLDCGNGSGATIMIDHLIRLVEGNRNSGT